MSVSANVSLFITHAWREHIDRDALERLLAEARDFTFVNTGEITWEAPGGPPGLGDEAAQAAIQRQIDRADVVVLLTAMFVEARSHDWVRYQLEYAKRTAKPVLVLTPYGSVDLPKALERAADAVVVSSGNDWRVWKTDEIVAAVSELRGRQVDEESRR